MAERTIGNFRLTERIGEGGMGEVYRGIDTMLERDVALKTLRPEIAARPELVERFRVEAIALAKLSHPNIAAVYSFFRDGAQYHMAMQFVRGRTLEQALARQGRFSWEQSAQVAADVLLALTHAHALGVIHRDLKPANLMLEESGRTVVMDFGIARVLARARQTRSGNLVGTMEYLAPELIKGGDADARSDIYSLGIVLYELVTGRLPFDGKTDYELMRAHTEIEPPSPAQFSPDLPPAMVEIILRALAKSPDDRFQSAHEFLEALGKTTNLATVIPFRGPTTGPHARRSRATTFQSLVELPVTAIRKITEQVRGLRRSGRSNPGSEAQASSNETMARATTYARANPGMALAAVAGVVAVGFAGAGAYQALTKPVVIVPVVKGGSSGTTSGSGNVPKPVAPEVPPAAAASKTPPIYQIPETPKAVVSIETPDSKPPVKGDQPPSPPSGQDPATPPAGQSPEPKAPPAVAKPAPKPAPATPPTTVAVKPPAPAPSPPPSKSKSGPPSASDSGWNIRR